MRKNDTFKTSYLIIKDSALILESYEGEMTFDVLLKHKQKLLADTDFDASFDVLTDLRNVTDSVSDTELLSFLANTKGVGFCGKGKNAALIASLNDKSFNESFGKLSSFLSIDYNYSTNLEQLLDYLGHEELREEVNRFFLEKKANQDFDWDIESMASPLFFKRLVQSIKSKFESERFSDAEMGVFNVEYKIIPERCLIIESYSGIVTLDDLGSHAHFLGEDPCYDNSYDHLLDVRRVFYKMSMNDLAIFAEVVRRGDLADKKKFGVLFSTKNQMEFNKMFGYIFEGFSFKTMNSKKLDDLLVFLDQKDYKTEIEEFLERKN